MTAGTQPLVQVHTFGLSGLGSRLGVLGFLHVLLLQKGVGLLCSQRLIRFQGSLLKLGPHLSSPCGRDAVAEFAGKALDPKVIT